MQKKKTRGEALLAQAKKTKENTASKRFDHIVGKQKNSAKFNKVNFNG